MSRPSRSAGIVVGGHHRVLRVGGERRSRPPRRPAGRSVAGARPAAAGRCRPCRPPAATSPTSWPWALRKVKHIPPPTSSRSTFGSSAEITASLSETLPPPSTTTYGRARGVAGQPGQHRQLARAPAHPRSPGAAWRRRRRWRACGAPRRRRRPRRPAGRRARPSRSANAPRSASSLLVSPGVEAHVLQQRDPPSPSSPRPRRRVADRVGGERHRAAEQLGQPRRDRAPACTSGPARPWAGPGATSRRPGRRRRAAGRASAARPGSGRRR